MHDTRAHAEAARVDPFKVGGAGARFRHARIEHVAAGAGAALEHEAAGGQVREILLLGVNRRHQRFSWSALAAAGHADLLLLNRIPGSAMCRPRPVSSDPPPPLARP